MTDRQGSTLISLVMPVFNEEANIIAAYERILGVFEPLAPRYDFEIVFTDNHSTDSTFALISKLAEKDRRVRGFRFSRNFGYQRSILEGYRQCRGDLAVQLDVDMQDPPELVPGFLELWEQGYKVVYGIRRSRPGEAAYLRGLRKFFYRLIDALSEDELPVDAGDFRLIDRCVLDVLARMDDAQPYLRGTIASMGFEQIGVPYDREERMAGVSKFSMRQYLSLSVDGMLNHSTMPLRIATYTGLTLAAVTALVMLGYVIGKFVLGQEWPAGFATTTTLLLLSLSLNAMFLGVIGEYLGRIYLQVKRGPNTIIERRVGE